MDTDRRGFERDNDARSRRAGAAPYPPLHQRLALSVLVAGASLWMRIVELAPDRRRRR
jgi:hypothetical protein